MHPLESVTLTLWLRTATGISNGRVRTPRHQTRQYRDLGTPTGRFDHLQRGMMIYREFELLIVNILIYDLQQVRA